MYTSTGKSWGNSSGMSKKELLPMKAWATGGGAAFGGGDDDGDGPEEEGGMLMAQHAEARQAADALFKPLEARAEGFKFADIVHRFEKAGSISDRDKRFKSFFPDALSAPPRQSLYPIMRLLIPQADASRGNYGLRQKSLGQVYVRLLGLGKEQADAARLTNWRDPTKGGSGSGPKGGAQAVFGEFSDILFDVIAKRVTHKDSALTIGQVNALLDRIVAAPDATAKAKVVEEEVFHVMSALEQKWLIRIILKDLKMGVKDQGLLKWLHPLAEPCFAVCCDLRKTCHALTDPAALASLGSRIVVGQPFTPMLAAGNRGHGPKGQLQACETAMKKRSFVMDIKLDGERMLCHKQGDSVRFFSRRANEYTHLYSPVMGQYITGHVKAENCVLDGELVGYDDAKGEGWGGKGGLVPFGSNRTIALAEAHAASHGTAAPRQHMFYIVFDVLHCGGGSMAGSAMAALRGLGAGPAPDGDVSAWPLRLRRRLLKEIIDQVPRRLELVKSREVGATSASVTKEARCAELQRFFGAAIDAGEEGLVVKDLESHYLVGEKSRASSHWVKMKPEYSDQTANLDVLIVGGYYGDGKRRAGLISHFLLAVADHTTLSADGTEPADVDATRWYTMGKVGSGYKMSELQELYDQIKDYKIPYEKPKGAGNNGSKYPKWLHAWNMKKDDVPDVFFPPNKSKIMEIKCAEIVTTDQFSSEHTPRFPRCENIRYDKSWHEAMTQKELTELCRSGARIGVAAGDAADGVGFGDRGARRLKRRAGQRVASVEAGRVLSDSTVVSRASALAGLPGQLPVSDVFAGYTFSVLPWDGEVKVPETPGVHLPWHRPASCSDGGASQSSQSQSQSCFEAGLDPEEESRRSGQRRERRARHSVASVQRLLYAHGASAVKGDSSYSEVDFVVCLSDASTKVRNLVALRMSRRAKTSQAAAGKSKAVNDPPFPSDIDECDVVRLAWVLDCVVAGEMQDLLFEYVVHASPATSENLAMVCDRFGDRYLVESHDSGDLRRAFDQVHRQLLCDDPMLHPSAKEMTRDTAQPLPWHRHWQRLCAHDDGGPLKKRLLAGDSMTPPPHLTPPGLSRSTPPPASMMAPPLLGHQRAHAALHPPPPLPPRALDWRWVCARSLTLEEQECMETRFSAFWHPRVVVYVDRFDGLGNSEAPTDFAPLEASSASLEAALAVSSKKRPAPISSSSSSFSDASSEAIRGATEEERRVHREALSLRPFSRLTAPFHLLRLLGCTVASDLHWGVTHVLVDQADYGDGGLGSSGGSDRALLLQRRLSELRSHAKAHYSAVRVVTAAWVHACAVEGAVRAPTHPGETARLF